MAKKELVGQKTFALPTDSLPFRVAPLRRFLETRIKEFRNHPDATLVIRKFSVGQSNPTFLLRLDPPPSPVSFSRASSSEGPSSSLSSSSLRQDSSAPVSFRFVLRKQPASNVPSQSGKQSQKRSKSAHQVSREYEIMSKLWRTGVPVPRVRCLCRDASLIDGEFFVMDFVEGRIFGSAALFSETMTAAERTACYQSAIA